MSEQPQTNRQHKDKLFVRIFSDLEHKDWIISLVNALSGTHCTDEEVKDMFYKDGFEAGLEEQRAKDEAELQPQA